jgi:hypothetical protein
MENSADCRLMANLCALLNRPHDDLRQLAENVVAEYFGKGGYWEGRDHRKEIMNGGWRACVVMGGSDL